MKKLRNILLSLLVVLIMFPNISYAAYSPQYTSEAIILKSLKIFNGTDVGFELERVSNRVEAAVLFVNFLGKAETAKQEKNKHQFNDLSNYPWAEDYIGYLYKYGFTSGVGDGQYGTRAISSNDLATFMLISLGYSANKDFYWNSATQTLKELGIISQGDYNEFVNNTFYRDQVVHMCYRLMTAKLKNSNTTIIEKLVADGAVSLEQIKASKDEALMKLFNMTNKNDSEIIEVSNYTVNSFEEFNTVLEKASKTLLSQVKVKVNNFDKNVYNLSNVEWDFISNINYSGSHSGNVADLVVNIEYSQLFSLTRAAESSLAYSRLGDSDKALMDKISNILNSILTDNMSEYEKELAIHDYCILNYKYDYNNYLNNSIPSASYTIDGLVNNKTGVCQAYAETVNVMLAMSGIESQVVSGTSNGQPHAWNIVKIDGQYYMLDVTWDDPVPDTGDVSYNYFNVTSEQLSKTHSWDKTAYPEAISDKYNYYVYNNLVTDSYESFKNAVQNRLGAGEKEITLFVKGYNKSEYDLSFIFNYCKSFSYSVVEDGDVAFKISVK